MTSKKIPIIINNLDYLKDHRSEGKSILPAVESLQLLASYALETDDPPDVLYSHDAQFSRFLPLPKDTPVVHAQIEFTPTDKNSLAACLLTKKQAGKTKISRSIRHVEVNFGAASGSELAKQGNKLITEKAVALEGLDVSFSSKVLYDDLVPFGPSFQNVTGSVFISESGAVGDVLAADHPSPQGPLGNGFVLDGAFHLACAWGQRYEGLLTFPVGYRLRKISRPCKTGEKYRCRVIPKGRQGQNLLFDIFILDNNGKQAEACLGLVFKDVSSGRLTPPAWIQEGIKKDQLRSLRSVCSGLTVVDLASISNFYDAVFTERERQRWSDLGPKRARDFGSARMALKLLARELLADWSTPASQLETLAEDNIHPSLPRVPDSRSLHCAASHDPRYAIAVASSSPIGVDVELLSEKVIRGSRMFLGKGEQELVSNSDLGAIGAATRIWTIKEAAAKALDMSLAKTFSRVQVVALGKEECEVLIGEKHRKAICAQVDDHLFTVLSISD